jgi:pyrrolidone-carboxylate peptidase
VVETSSVGCDAYISEVIGEVQKCSPRVINIHLGVNGGGKEFELESCGYNLMDFSIPDVKGLQVRD